MVCLAGFTGPSRSSWSPALVVRFWGWWSGLNTEGAGLDGLWLKHWNDGRRIGDSSRWRCAATSPGAVRTLFTSGWDMFEPRPSTPTARRSLLLLDPGGPEISG